MLCCSCRAMCSRLVEAEAASSGLVRRLQSAEESSSELARRLQETEESSSELARKLQEAEASREAAQQANAAALATVEDSAQVARSEAEGLKAQLAQVGCPGAHRHPPHRNKHK